MSWKPDAPSGALFDTAAVPAARGARGNTALREPAYDRYSTDLAGELFGPADDTYRYPGGDERVGALLTAALASAPGAVALVRDHDHRVDFVNRAFRDAFGLPADACGPLAGLVPQFEQLGLLDVLDHVYATGTVFTAPEVRVSGYGPGRRPAVLRMTCSAVKHPQDGPVTGALISIIDCTDQTSAVDRLRRRT